MEGRSELVKHKTLTELAADLIEHGGAAFGYDIFEAGNGIEGEDGI
jgi:hypothetical protein